MRKKHKHIEPDHYIVVNTDNQVYTGMIKGSFNYSDDWSKAKPLALQSTSYLTIIKGNQLLKL